MGQQSVKKKRAGPLIKRPSGGRLAAGAGVEPDVGLRVIAAGETLTGSGPLLLSRIARGTPRKPVIGVFATSDPRIDEASRTRCQNIARMTAMILSGAVVLPDGTPVQVVYSDVLVDGEREADIVAQQFLQAGVNILVCVPDTWAFPQLTLISLLQQFPRDTPINITCGNSGPRPGVVYAHATNGALAQYGRMVSTIVGNWPDIGADPKMSAKTAKQLIDWCYAAVTTVALRGRRVVVFGHDSMGMETALAHIIPTRNTFGIEVTRLDMKLLADMLTKGAYNQGELGELREWVRKHVGRRVEIRDDADEQRLLQELAMYLVVRDIMADLNAVGGGFMSQLEWGSDPRGIPLPVADIMESFFNSTFDHRGPKAPWPFATEADFQRLLTMLFLVYLSGGKPPLFADFRKAWESWEIKQLARKIHAQFSDRDLDGVPDYWRIGCVDADNSGSAAFDWAAKPGASVQSIMRLVSMPLADPGYFPGGGNSVTFVTPGGIEGVAAGLAYCSLSGLFTMIWDQITTALPPEKLARAMCNLTTSTWPHSFLVPRYATMVEYKSGSFRESNHTIAIRGVSPARIEHFTDLTGVQSATPWAARPKFIEGVDREPPLVHLLAGGETQYKLLTLHR